MPHDTIEQLGPDLFIVRSQFRVAPLCLTTRTMTIVRTGQDLVLINGVRLTEQGHRQLDALGRVRHVIKLGDAHAADDPFLVDHYGATLWALTGARHKLGLQTERVLSEDGPLPLSAELIALRHSKHPEGVLRLDTPGGTVITCDAAQNHADDRHYSPMTRACLGPLGYRRPAAISLPWKWAMSVPGGPSLREDFARILDWDFDDLVTGHGPALRGGARAHLQASVDHTLPQS